MRKLRKALAILLSAAMVLGMSSVAFAVNETGDTTEAAASGSLKLDEEISISGLTDGDEVKLYQVAKWQENDGWVKGAGFEGLTDELFKRVVGSPSDATKDPAVPAIKAKITAADAGVIGEQITDSVTAKYTETAASGKVTVSSPEAGLYIAIITPGEAGYVYNPVFVSCDYQQPETNNTNTWGVTEALTYDDANKALAKKTTLKDEKSATLSDAEIAAEYADKHPETVQVGSHVPFTVKTVIPKFASNYTNPVFKITDTLSDGLTLDQDSVTIVKPTDITEEEDYTITKSDDGFVIKFKPAYLKSAGPAVDFELTYTAVVTSAAVTNIDREANTLDINYSNHPDDEDGYGLLRTKTNHYMFAIDGTLFGSDDDSTTEVVKIGVDNEGNEITETRVINGDVKVGALQGAVFGLYTDEACTKLYEGKDKNGSVIFDGQVTSDADGRMTITGLDAGIYYLKEITAPAGYIKDTTVHKVEIIAEFDTETYTETETIGGKKVEVTYTSKVLTKSTIKIDGVITAEYTVENVKIDGEDSMTVEAQTYINEDNFTGKLRNVQGTELPATGGMGTTLFYIIGSILVIGAGIILVAKKRMSMR